MSQIFVLLTSLHFLLAHRHLVGNVIVGLHALLLLGSLHFLLVTETWLVVLVAGGKELSSSDVGGVEVICALLAFVAHAFPTR